jgi:alpha-D-ribose 1-methylphosphonate 5-triphosphate synthase subunit PhnL
MALLRIESVGKRFTMHLRGGLQIPVIGAASLAVAPGECVVLAGPSGAGKSSILKMVYGNYRCEEGRILVAHRGAMVDVASARPREIIALRQHSMAYVSQFLRVIPRIGTLEVVAAAARAFGSEAREARVRAAGLLERLNVPPRLWELPPATFSGGEQQRVNIARGLAGGHPLLLLDEPTASLDAANRAVVVELVRERLRGGTGVLAIFHDADVRDQLADRLVDVTCFADAA